MTATGFPRKGFFVRLLFGVRHWRVVSLLALVVALTCVGSAVADAAPSNTVLPVVSGTAQVGASVSATPGTWTADPAPSFAYQWQRCDSSGAACVGIGGATGSAYSPVAADVAKTLRAVVTATNSGGSASATSGATPVIMDTYSSTVLSDGPRSYWRLGEATGTTAADASGNGLNATYGAGVTLGAVGALTYDSNTAATFNANTASRPVVTTQTSSVTLEAWVYWAGNSGFSNILYNGNWGRDGYGLFIAENTCAAGTFLVVLVGGQGCNPMQRWTIPSNQWTHVALVGPASGAWTLYVNGAARTSGNVVPYVPTGNTWISCCNFSGRVDEAAVYTTALSAARIAAHYNAGKPSPWPVMTAAPAVSGTVTDGWSLTATDGTWTNSPTFTRQWQRCDAAGACVDIAGATGTTYVLGAGDAGKTVRVRVVAANSGGSVSATSAVTAKIAARTIVMLPAPDTTGFTFSALRAKRGRPALSRLSVLALTAGTCPTPASNYNGRFISYIRWRCDGKLEFMRRATGSWFTEVVRCEPTQAWPWNTCGNDSQSWDPAGEALSFRLEVWKEFGPGGRTAVGDLRSCGNGCYYRHYKPTGFPGPQAGGGCNPSGMTAAPTRCTADPVNTATGGFRYGAIDATLGGRGLDLVVERSYDSDNPQVGPFGRGWAFPFSSSLSVQSSGDVVLFGPDGQRVDLYLQGDGSFLGRGVTADLVSVAGGYELLSHDQLRYRFDSAGALRWLEDGNGNRITVGYDAAGRLSSLTDASNRTAAVTVNGDDRITAIALPDGRTISYGYGGGRLSSATVAGATTSYTYDGSDLLKTVVDGNGHTEVENTYAENGRVVSQKDALGKTTTFAWDEATGTFTATDPRGNAWKDVYDGNRLVKQVDGKNNETLTAYDANFNPTSVTAPGGATTALTHDANGNLTQAVAPAALGGTKTLAYNAKNKVTSITDARGVVTAYSYDADGNLTEEFVAGTKVAGYAYNADGQLTSSTDGRNHTTTYTYDTYGNRTSVTDPLGNKTTFAYNSSGWLTARTDPRGNVLGANPTDYTTSYSYDAAGRLLTETDPLGHVSTNTYDALGNRLTATDPNGKTTSYTYDNANRLKTVTAPDGGVTTYGYDDAGNRTTTTDPLGHVTTSEYDQANRRIATTTAAGNKTTFFYDGNGNLVKRVDPRGNVTGANPDDFATTYTYDAAGRMLTETNALGKTTTYGYDAVGNRTSITDAKSHTTTYAYDNRNRVITKTAPDGGVTAYSYDAAGNEIARVDERGKTWTSSYDDANRLVSSSDPLGNTTTYAYDAAGNLVNTVEPRGTVPGANPADYMTTFTYDRAGRKTADTDPLGNATAFAYDDAGNRTSVTDALGHVTAYEFDAVNRLKKVIAPGGLATTYAYDLAGNLVKRTDPKQHELTYVYDADDRRTSVTTPSGSTWTLAYDRAGNLVSKVDANGNATQAAGDGTTGYGYDAAGRLTGIDFSDSTPDVQLAYDNAGNPSSMTDGEGTKSWTYDAADRPLTATRGASGFAYQYDPAGNVTKRTYPDGTVADYAYDDAQRLATVVSAGASTSYGYDPAGRVVSTTPPSGNGHVETRDYDRAGRLTGVKAAKNGVVLDEFVSTLDAVGNPTKIVRSGQRTETSTFSYDVRDQLTGVCYQLSCLGPSDPFVRWTYDAVGNRASEERPAGTTTFTYNSADQVTGDGTRSFVYDANGNQTSAGSRSFAYDLADRVTSTVQGSSTTTFAYDGDGHRVRRTGGGQTVDYSWDDSWALPQLALEQDAAGGLVRRYLYGDRRISVSTPSSASFFHYDPIGSVSSLTSSTGGLEWSYAYDPFGDLRASSQVDPAAPLNGMLFAGELLDDSGLYHLRARDYDPALGRFQQADPVEQAVGDPALTTYHYALNRPTVLVDPSGEQSQPLQPTDKGTTLPNYATRPVGGGPAGCATVAAPDCNAYWRWLMQLNPSGGGYSGGTPSSADPSGGGSSGGPSGGDDKCAGLLVLSCMKDWFVQDQIGWTTGCARSTSCLLTVELNLAMMTPIGRGARAGKAGAELAAKGGQGARPAFVGFEHGPPAIVPKGATGPIPPSSPGIQYVGGAGGHGLDPRVTGVRIMDQTAHHPPRVVYMNEQGQSVNPVTGRTVEPDDPWAHIPW